MISLHHNRARVALSILPLLLAACGGGGDSSGEPEPFFAVQGAQSVGGPAFTACIQGIAYYDPDSPEGRRLSANLARYYGFVGSYRSISSEGASCRDSFPSLDALLRTSDYNTTILPSLASLPPAPVIPLPPAGSPDPTPPPESFPSPPPPDTSTPPAPAPTPTPAPRPPSTVVASLVSHGYYRRGAFNEYRIYLENRSAFRIRCMVDGNFSYADGGTTLKSANTDEFITLEAGTRGYVRFYFTPGFGSRDPFDRNIQMGTFNTFPCRVL